jgi:lysozyme
MISCLADQLRRDEGCRLKLYQDTVGKWTIGIGRNLSDVGISQEEADLLLQNDIKAATVSLESTFPWTMALDDVRKDVLLNMVFNMGVGGLATFRGTLSLLEAKDFSGAAQAMLASKWAEQVGPRAQRLSIQLESGTYQ